MNHDIFTWPFLIGTTYLVIVVLFRFVRWITGLSKFDKLRIWKGLFTKYTLLSFKEAFREGLLHRKIFRKNPVLGYMHMSLAFGWFLLIVVGHMETVLHFKSFSFPFFLPIFFRYFVHGHHSFVVSGFFSSLMDLLLLFVLSGVGLAFYKRFNSKVFGMKKATRLKSGDKLALISLWFIFPLRFAAEILSAGVYHNGGIITQPLGSLLTSFVPVQNILYPTWFAYSLSLGLFFIALPNSRYMHIPAEILFIFLRNYSIRLKKRCNGYTQVQVFSCSRCGICLDVCQMNKADIDTQSVYVLKNIRNNNLSDEVLFNCLLCGRCQQVCPVGIEMSDLRVTQRIESTRQYNSQYDYLKKGQYRKAKVLYFAGCMTHLTPSIKKAMVQIFDYAGIDYWFMDEEKSPCCGRPLMQAGQFDAAQKLIYNNENTIQASGASCLVTSCPICYKVFKEDYHLPHIKVLHHSEYILHLVNSGLLPAENKNLSVVYHDPCELGRGEQIYQPPRNLLSLYANVIKTRFDDENSLCCGGSLSNIKIQMNERDIITYSALNDYLSYQPEALITSCPLCKKTFSRPHMIPVLDIAEIVADVLSEKLKIADNRLMDLESSKQSTRAD